MTKKQADPDTLDTPADESPEPGATPDPGTLEWREGFRSMLDHPAHPLHHLRNA